MKQDKNITYDYAIDLLRVVAVFAVVLIHTTTRTIEASNFKLLEIPWTLFLNQAARFSVPLFFMISGFVLELNHHFNETYLRYFKKRISRILVPYIFWSMIYYFFVYYKNRDPNIFNVIFGGDASYQLYFIPTLVIFYFIFPIIHKFLNFIGNKWIMVILGLVQVILLFINYYVKPFNLYYPIAIALLNFFVFIFGIYLAKNKQRMIQFIAKSWLILFIGTICLSLTVFYEGYSGYLTTHNYLTFYSQWRPSVLVYTLTLFGFLYWIFSNKKIQWLNFIKLLSKLSFFVFFIHVIILELVWFLLFKNIFNVIPGSILKNIIFDPSFCLLVLVVSYLIAFLIHKIPVMNKLTG